MDWRRLWNRLLGREELPPPEEWARREVLVGVLRSREQLEVNLSCGFYHIPADVLGSTEEIRYIAIYQSRRFFGGEAGVYFYGRVTRTDLVPRYRIRELPRDSDKLYVRFTVERWERLEHPILPRERGFIALLTTRFLLLHAREIPELSLEGPEQYRVYRWLHRCASRHRRFAACRVGPVRLRLRRGRVSAWRAGERLTELPLLRFTESPGSAVGELSRLCGFR